MRKKVLVCCRRAGAVWKEKRWEILVVLLCVVVLCGFVSQKEGFHMDELLCFELANAEFNPWIVPTQPEGRLAKFVHNEIDGDTLGETIKNIGVTVQDVLRNRGNSKLLTYQADVYPEPVWITAEQFTDYIQVDSSDAFNYLSVYFNVKDDNHPPLHFMLLHTVSSLFRGRAEAWMGCVINLAAVTGVLVLLLRLGRLYAKQLGLGEYARNASILCALLYGLSTGAVATTLLIRMYGLLTLWCMAYFYLVVKKWRDGEFQKRNKGLILVTLLGFWTQYFFLFYCILLAAVVSVLLVRAKRLRELGGFVRSMMIAAVTGVVVFPFAISDVFSSGRGVEALGNLAAGFRGYGTRLREFLQIVGSRTLWPIFWILLALLAASAFLMRKGRRASAERVCQDGKAPYILMLVLPAVGYFLLAARMSPYLVDRYMMPVFPFVIVMGMLVLFWLLKLLKQPQAGGSPGWMAPLACCLAVAGQLIGLCQYDGNYLYRGYAMQEQAASEKSDYPCICIYDGVGYYENLPEFTHYEKTLLLTFDQLVDRQDKADIEKLEKVAVLIKESTGYESDQVIQILKEQYGLVPELQGWQGTGIQWTSVHGDSLIFMGKDA